MPWWQWMVMGVILLVVEMATPGGLFAVFFGIGAFLVVTGFRVVHSPTPKMMRLDAITMFIVAAWNLLVGALDMAFASGSPAPLLLGCAQIYWGVKSVRRQREYVAMVADDVPAAALAEIETVVDKLSRRHVEEVPTVIDFKTSDVSSYHRWRLQLDQRWALFVDRASGEVMVVPPDEISVDDRGEGMIGHQHKATIRVPGRELKGKMAVSALQALSAWKAAPAV